MWCFPGNEWFSDETSVGRRRASKGLNSGEILLAGVGCIVGRPNSGEAAVVGGDRLFRVPPPAENPLIGRQRKK